MYARIDRQRIPETFIHFDFATPDMATGRRHVTTVPQQTLFFMNSPMVIELAKKLVARPDFRAGYGRGPRHAPLRIALPTRTAEIELALGLDFLEDTVTAGTAEPVLVADARRVRVRSLPPRAGAAKESARPSLTVWQEYAQALLQANEFIFVQ